MPTRFARHSYPAPYPRAPLLPNVGHLVNFALPHLTSTVSAGFQPATSLSNNATLFIKGNANLTWVGELPLHTHGIDTKTGTMNLSIVGGYPKVDNSLPLFLANNVAEVNDYVELFIKGTGVNPGYFPIDGSLNLYIERGATGGIPLFIGGYIAEGNLPLYIFGRQEAVGQADLFIKGEGGTSSNSITLVIPNAVGTTAATGQITLVIPNAIGYSSESIELYIGGWI